MICKQHPAIFFTNLSKYIRLATREVTQPTLELKRLQAPVLLNIHLHLNIFFLWRRRLYFSKINYLYLIISGC